MLSQIDKELTLRDNSLPGLRLLLDTEYIQNRINTHLPYLKIKKVKNTYLNYKPSNKCIVLHNLISDSGSLLAYSTVYGLQKIDNERKRLENRISDSKHKRSQGVELTREFNNFDNGIITYFLPVDRRLKNIVKLYDTEYRNKLFSYKLPQNQDLIDSEIVPINYKPEKRFVAKLSKNSKEASVIKLYGDSYYEHAAINSRLYKNNSAFFVPNLQKRISKLNCLVYEWVDGKNLNSLILNNNPQANIVENVGTALGELNNQKITKQLKFDRKYFIYKLLSISQDVSYLLPNISVKINRIVNRVSELLLNIPDIYIPIHGDFNADQVIVGSRESTGDSSLCLLDFDQSCLGHPAFDIGNFIAHYINQSYKISLNSSLVTEIRESIENGFFKTSKIRIDADDINIFTVACLIRLLTDPFKYRYGDWDNSIYDLLEYIKQTTDKLKNKNTFYVSSEDNYIEIDDSHSAASDSRMPYMKYALDPEYMQSLFDTHMLSNSQPKPKISSIEVIRYKKERRCLLEYKFRNNRNLCLIGKTKARGSVKSNYKLNDALYNSGFDEKSDDFISIPKPVFYNKNLNMWFQRKVDGDNYRNLLLSTNGLEYTKLIARSAHKIHKCNIDSGKTHTIDNEIEILEDRLSKVSVSKPTLSGRINNTLLAAKNLASSIADPVLCSIHRDFYHDQLIINGNRIYLLDFDLYCKGDPAVDIGNFLAHLTELSIRTNGNADGYLDIENEIEKQYLSISDLICPDSIQAYKTLTLLRHIYISTLFVDRCIYTEQILNLCEQRLQDYL
ncbi:MAG TPA: phosphotransferase [Thermodesulfobacteriota bacterium]|nr:phosphotransferase [Thermodesulfobacteriota bacterium]